MYICIDIHTHLFLLAHPASKSGLHDLDYAPVSLIMQLVSQVRFYYVYVYIYIYIYMHRYTHTSLSPCTPCIQERLA